jgi:hypothetical protein
MLDLDHIADRAGFLAALSRQDPERQAADQHVQSCADCRAALDEGIQLVGLLRRALPIPAAVNVPAPKWARARMEPAAPLRFELAVAGAVGVAWLFQLTVGGGFRLDRSCLAGSLAILAVAIASVTLLSGRERLAVATVLATSALFATLSGSAAGFAPSVGVRCTFRELWAAAITWAIVLTIGRRRGVLFDRWSSTSVAAAGALAAHAGQHLACAVPHSDAHLLVFHFGGVVLAALLGALSVGRATSIPAAA